MDTPPPVRCFRTAFRHGGATAVTAVRIGGPPKCASAPRVDCAVAYGRGSPSPHQVAHSLKASGPPSACTVDRGHPTLPPGLPLQRHAPLHGRLQTAVLVEYLDRALDDPAFDLPRHAGDHDRLDGSAQRPQRPPEVPVRSVPRPERRRRVVARVGVDEHGALGAQRDGQLDVEVPARGSCGTPQYPRTGRSRWPIPSASNTVTLLGLGRGPWQVRVL